MSRPVLAILDRTVLQDALLALVNGAVRHLAVVDADGRCVGMVTDRMLAAGRRFGRHPRPHRRR